MSQQNFVEQFRLFMEYTRKNSMHSRECMLWVSLFYLANEEATYNAETQTYEWPDDFFEVSNGELNSYGKFDKQAIESLRNRLKQRGLIDFIKGNRNSAAPMYKINYFVRAGNKIIPNIHAKPHAKDDANIHANIPPNPHAKDDANIHANIPPIDININNIIPGSTEPVFPEDEEDQEEELPRTQARGEILASWRDCFGREPTAFIVNELANRSASLGFQPGVLTEAIRAAAWSEARTPMGFITSTLVDWHNHHIQTVEDVDEYAALRDMEKGKLGPAAQYGAAERIRAFAEDREAPKREKIAEEA